MSHPTPARPCLRLLAPLLVGGLTGCAHRIDKITVNRVVARAMTVPDVNQACEIGVSLRSPLAAVTKEQRPPRLALVVAEATAGMCDEASAWEVELELARALGHKSGLDPLARVSLAQDLRIQADRLHRRAAARYARSWEQGLAHFGAVGQGDCPRLKAHEELPYLLTLVSGMQMVLHDSASGSVLSLPKETILDVARGAACVDDQTWWHGPSALQAAAWVTIPGSAPEGVDPWALLSESARLSDATGVRVSRGLQATIGANAGRDDVVLEAISGHSAALASTPTTPRFALFDVYAGQLSLFQSDLIWMKEEGHRTAVFGLLPGAEAPASGPAGPDPFADDPFAVDPFAADPSAGGPAGSDAPPPPAPPAPGQE